jgi:hypothetical protein
MKSNCNSFLYYSALIILLIIVITCIPKLFTNTTQTTPNAEHFDIDNVPTNVPPTYNFPTIPDQASGGFIDKKNCNTFCQQRYELCQSYFTSGQTNWCSYLKSKCNEDCQWNDVYNN